jgi:hypothetical protein
LKCFFFLVIIFIYFGGCCKNIHFRKLKEPNYMNFLFFMKKKIKNKRWDKAPKKWKFDYLIIFIFLHLFFNIFFALSPIAPPPTHLLLLFRIILFFLFPFFSCFFLFYCIFKIKFAHCCHYYFFLYLFFCCLFYFFLCYCFLVFLCYHCNFFGVG